MSNEHYTERTGRKLERLIEKKVKEVTGQTRNPYLEAQAMKENGVVRWKWMIPILLAIAGALSWTTVGIVSAGKSAEQAKSTAEKAMPRSEAYPATRGAKLEVRLDQLQEDMTEVKADIKTMLEKIDKALDCCRRRRR